MTCTIPLQFFQRVGCVRARYAIEPGHWEFDHDEWEAAQLWIAKVLFCQHRSCLAPTI